MNKLKKVEETYNPLELEEVITKEEYLMILNLIFYKVFEYLKSNKRVFLSKSMGFLELYKHGDKYLYIKNIRKYVNRRTVGLYSFKSSLLVKKQLNELIKTSSFSFKQNVLKHDTKIRSGRLCNKQSTHRWFFDF